MDAELLNREFDLLGLVEGDTTLRSHGAWHEGPCPFCGGTDRFVLHQTSQGTVWFCRGCGDGKYHDAIDYIMRRENLNFQEALAKMGGTNSQPNNGKWVVGTTQEKARRVAEIAADIRKPPPDWRKRGEAYIAACQRQLFSPEGAKALAYLQSRGFFLPTLARYRIGFNPADRYEPLEKWGLDSDSGQVWLARGITIPCYGPDGLYYIKTRRAIAAGSNEKKYVKVLGSKPGMFGEDNLRGAWLIVVTEGEFDAMILWQNCADMAGICTFGSATDSPLNVDPDLFRWFYTAEHLFVCFDNDEQGLTGAHSFLEKIPRARTVNLPEKAHDLNDYHLAGGDLARWLGDEAARLGIIRPGKNSHA